MHDLFTGKIVEKRINVGEKSNTKCLLQSLFNDQIYPNSNPVY